MQLLWLSPTSWIGKHEKQENGRHYWEKYVLTNNFCSRAVSKGRLDELSCLLSLWSVSAIHILSVPLSSICPLRRSWPKPKDRDIWTQRTFAIRTECRRWGGSVMEGLKRASREHRCFRLERLLHLLSTSPWVRPQVFSSEFLCVPVQSHWKQRLSMGHTCSDLRVVLLDP